MAFQLKLQKRRTKERDIKKRDDMILQLTMRGMTSAEIGSHPEINYAVHNGQCQRVIQIQNDLVQQGRLKKNANGSFVINVQKVEEHKWNKVEADIARTQCKELVRTMEYLQANGRKQLGITTILNSLVVTFNTLGIHPSEIINAVDEKGEPDYLEKSRWVLREIQKKLASGDIAYIKTSRVGRNLTAKDDITVKSYNSALRAMLIAHNKAIPKLPKTDILSGTKGAMAGAYNTIGLNDKETEECILFIEQNGKDILKKSWDFGYVGFPTLMPEMITRTEALAMWKLNFVTEHDELEHQHVEYDFVQGFFETKTAKSRPQGWDKFIVNPIVRNKLKQISEYRNGKTLVQFNESKASSVNSITRNVNTLMKEFYIHKGILPPETRLKFADRPEHATFRKGSKQFFFDNMGAYVLRHSGAHMWCRRTKYDYGFVAEIGWTDMNTLRDFYAGQNIKQRLKENDCFYCNPPKNPELMNNKIFCSAPHAFIYFANGMKAKSKGDSN